MHTRAGVDRGHLRPPVEPEKRELAAVTGAVREFVKPCQFERGKKAVVKFETSAEIANPDRDMVEHGGGSGVVEFELLGLDTF